MSSSTEMWWIWMKWSQNVFETEVHGNRPGIILMRNLVLWSFQCLRTLVGHTGGVWSSQMRDNIIISGSTDRTLKVWNAETGECIHTLYGHTSTVRCMHLHEKRYGPITSVCCVIRRGSSLADRSWSKSELLARVIIRSLFEIMVFVSTNAENSPRFPLNWVSFGL